MTYHLAFVTGATSGIGQATCELLAHKGINLIASGRNQQQLELLKEELSPLVEVQTLQADLAQLQERQRVMEVIHEHVPDLVINNAGFGLYGEALTYSTEQQADMLEVNGRAVLELTLEAARTLISHERQGVILNVSSVAGFYSFPNSTVYAASKAFVTHFSQAMDDEVKPYGVRVLTLCPGVVATSFQKRAGIRVDSWGIGVMTPQFVAEQIWKQIEQLRPITIINWRYRILRALSFLFPRSWVVAIGKKAMAQRMAPRTLIKIKK